MSLLFDYQGPFESYSPGRKAELLEAMRDDYLSGEVLADQTGADNILTFTFQRPQDLVVVHSNGVDTDFVRIDPFGGTPTATLGIPCGDETPTYIPVTTSQVKIYCPTGIVVSVWGHRRSL